MAIDNGFNSSKLRLDSDEAPDGFRAVEKRSISGIYEFNQLVCPNLCTFCDFRKDCDTLKHPCQGYRRADKCSVLFKKENKC